MNHGNLFTRPDTFLGVCEAIGEDLGCNPNWLRIVVGVMLLWQPVWVICGYLAVGIVVLALRLAMPNRTAPPARTVAETADDAGAPILAEAA